MQSQLLIRRTSLRRMLLLCIAGASLFSLLFLAQQGQAQAMTSVPDNLGSVSGVVTDANGAPLANVEVALYSQSGSYTYNTVKTDANGAYQLTLVPPGVYHIRFYDLNQQYATQWYTTSSTLAKATDIVVAGQPVTGVNTSLVIGGRLGGGVTIQQIAPARNGWVSFYTQQAGEWQVITTASISQTGQYISEALLPGVYRLCAAAYLSGSSTYLTGCYGGADVEQATDISLTAGENKTNLNMDIGVGAFNSVLSGIVTGDGGPRPGIKVSVYNYDGYYGPSTLVYGFTDATGRYSIGGLPTSRYRVGFSDPAGLYATTYYTNSQYLEYSKLVTLQDSEVISTVNVTLAHGGALQGNIHRYTGKPVPNVRVSLLRPYDEFFDFSWRVTSIYTTTDANGNYTFRGLWPGVYRIGIQCYVSYDERCLEYYGSKRSALLAQDVVVNVDQTTTGIDVTFGIENPVFLPLVRQAQ